MSECDHLILKMGATAEVTQSTRGKNI